MATSVLAGKFPLKLLKGDIDVDTDTWKATLHTSSATLAKDTTEFFNTVGNELATAGGYTAGGATLTLSTPVYTAANSWGVSRANATAYAVGDVVRPASGNGFLYVATTAGTSGGSVPSYPTVVGQTVVDGGVTWSCIGTGMVSMEATDPTWAGATFTARYCVIRKDTGTPSTSPVVGWVDFTTNQSPAGVPFTVALHASGLLLIPV